MRASIAGVRSTEFSSSSGRSELRLAVEAIRGALADAGVEPSAVDGIVKYTYDTNAPGELVRALGTGDLTFFAEIPYGGSACCGVVAQAAAAIDAGLASCVVCFRALNGRSGTRLGRAERHLGAQGDAVVARGTAAPGGAYTAPFGYLVPAQAFALSASRYQHVHGISDERLTRALGAVAVTERAYAQANPRAVTYGQPLSYEQYLEGRMISAPLRLYDLCRETDGAVALVVMRDDLTPAPGVRILAARQHFSPNAEPMPTYAADLTTLVPERAVAELYEAAGVRPDDIDVAAIYDHTTLSVVLTLEDFGFCRRGEGVDFVLEGGIGPEGRLPTNTSGGLLSEGYIHGMNVVAEAVAQLRQASCNQVPGARRALVTSRLGSLVLEAAAP